ncbi:MAG: hypothetical protein R2762_00515 [Bryobacteraceae bacterium]
MRVFLLAVAACLAHAAFCARIEPFAAAVEFVEPFGVAFDRAGNAYVIEYKGNRLHRIAPNGGSIVFAGAREGGFAGDGRKAAEARFHEPHGVVISPDQMLYVADTHNNRVRRIDLATGLVSTVAGNGKAGFSGDGGPATEASFKGIFAIDLSPAGDKLYLADLGNVRVRMVDLKTGLVSTVAGNGESAEPSEGARAASSPLVDPRAVAADARGNVYVLERRGNALRVVGRDGRIRTLIRPGQAKPDLKGPKHLCVDRNGGVWIADAENHLVRRYSVKSRTLTTVAGTGEQGDRIVAEDPLRTQLARPHGVFVHPSGAIYITDSYNHRLLRMRP